MEGVKEQGEEDARKGLRKKAIIRMCGYVDSIHLSTASGKRGCKASCIKLLRNEMSCHTSCCLACQIIKIIF